MSEVLADNTVRLVCPFCHVKLDLTNGYLRCFKCTKDYPLIDSIPVFTAEAEQDANRFYEDWYREPHRAYNLEGVGQPVKSSPFIMKYEYFFEKILYTQFRREIFFKRVLTKFLNNCRSINVLDLGCGGGTSQFLNFGDVYGVDYSIASMKNGIASRDYKIAVSCNAARLPFESEKFDCIVSSDLIGHVHNEEKDGLFLEMKRVLKCGGICAHVIETDSENFIKRFAKGHPELYRKYFVEGTGGHFGLELPAEILKRFRSAGLLPVSIKKYYSYIWDIESFIALFDNEYSETSFLIKALVSFYRLLCRSFPVKIVAASITGLFSFIVDAITPINTAEGIMVVCVKGHTGAE
jgi:ubiquinone/menaquinone biosynthesis C-methylase UbiE